MTKVAAAESDANRALITRWVAEWSDRAQAALAPVAELALGTHGAAALGEVCEQFAARCKKLGVAA